MARTTCKCGELLSNSMAPNDIELRVYTDREWDKILEVDTINTWEIPSPTYNIWRCPKCERVMVYDWGYDKPPVKTYVLED